MKIALIGYGKMGKEIEKQALSRGHQIVLKLNKDDIQNLPEQELSKAEIAIEFTSPEAAISNIKKCFHAGIPVVTGTTGWYHEFERIKEQCLEMNGALFHATNFSVGVNLFFKFNEMLAELMYTYKEYKVTMEEAHHLQKKDAPSGTAITLANGILNHYSNLHGYTIDLDHDHQYEKLPIKVVREGEVTGTHIVKYQSKTDEITLSHKAFNRQGFALGAVIAAEFLLHKKGIYTMSDLLKL